MKKSPVKTITLVEASIVLVIFSILSSIVIPELSHANSDFRDETLQSGLQQLRDQTVLYRQEHGGRLPQADTFVAQLTMRSNEAGKVMPPTAKAEDYPLGPYLERIPRNPYVNKRFSDRVEAGPGYGGDHNAGWYYNEETGEIWPGNDGQLDY